VTEDYRVQWTACKYRTLVLHKECSTSLITVSSLKINCQMVFVYMFI